MKTHDYLIQNLSMDAIITIDGSRGEKKKISDCLTYGDGAGIKLPLERDEENAIAVESAVADPLD